jgi:hypothetical protein
MIRVLSLALAALLSFASVAMAQECESPPPPPQGETPST